MSPGVPQALLGVAGLALILAVALARGWSERRLARLLRTYLVLLVVATAVTW